MSDIQELWREFSEAILENVIPSSTIFTVNATGSVVFMDGNTIPDCCFDNFEEAACWLDDLRFDRYLAERERVGHGGQGPWNTEV
jgi:hypothetical protein